MIEIPSGGFTISDDCYTSRLCMVNIPREYGLKHGGDFCAQLWRYNAKPDEWYVTYRVRYNAGPNTDPFTFQDRKSWFTGLLLAKGDAAKKEFVELVELLPLKALGNFQNVPVLEIDWLIIEGGPDKFMEVCEREKKPWMHIRKAKV